MFAIILIATLAKNEQIRNLSISIFLKDKTNFIPQTRPERGIHLSALQLNIPFERNNF